MKLYTILSILLLCASVASAGWLQWYSAAGAARRGGATFDHTDGGSLKLWWRMDATDTGAYIVDASGSGNYATQDDIPRRATITNGYASLDGGDFASIVSSTLFDGATNMLISAWVNPSAKVNDAGIMRSGGAHFSGFAAGTKTNVWLYINQLWYLESAANSTPTGSWTHVAGHWTTDGYCSLWINGARVAYRTDISSGIALIINDSWRLGLDDSFSDRMWNGLLDDVRIYVSNPSGTNFVTKIYAAGRQ